MKPNYILILDPRGVILAGGEDVVERHKTYARNLSEPGQIQHFSLLILSASKGTIKDYQSKNMEIRSISKPTLNSLSFARKSAKLIKLKGYQIKLLVCGDPWESFWASYFFNKILKKAIPIQAQIHGDIGNIQWQRISFINRLRFMLARFSLPKAEGIRAVSAHQAQLVVKNFKVEKNRVSIIPIPISNFRLTKQISNDRPHTLALIGRVHKDRGINNFIKLIEYLSHTRKDFDILIAGDGPGEARFLVKLSKIVPDSKIKFHGKVSEMALIKLWEQIGVLVSCAQTESYGRVMREAIVAGIPVWATRSSGVEDLLSKSNKTSIKILDLTKSDKELSRELDQLFKAKVDIKLRKQIIKDNSTYSRLLAKSWLNLIDKNTKF